MSNKDYYDILGISKKANNQEIKRAYKRLAIKYHPDRNKGNKIYEEKFKEIQKAYEILSDTKKRSMYDQYGHTSFNEDNYTDFTYTSNDFSDIFGDVFGDIFKSKKNKKYSNNNIGSDVLYKISITLEEVIKGVSKKIGVNLIQKCSICNGTGCKSGTSRKVCNTCNGNGNIHIKQGFFTIQQTCPSCNGECYIIENVCYICRGSGTEKVYKNFSIKIPSGINDGDNIRIIGKGNYGGYNSKCGDLYIKIKVKKHSIFKRFNNDLYCKVPINFSIAALGGKIEIPSLYNKIIFKIPPETQTGKIFRIKNKGIKYLKNNKYGDLLCKIIVETPVNLNKLQKKLLYNLGITLKKNIKKNNPKSDSFLNNLKKFFNSLI